MTRSAGTTSNPSGLHWVEASFATNLVGATPTEQVMPCSSCTCARIISAIARGGPWVRRAPETSRKASSRPSTSTREVIAVNSSMTEADTSV